MEIGGIKFNIFNFFNRYKRLQRTRKKFFDYAALKFDGQQKFPKNIVSKQKGYQAILDDYRDKYKGQRCFVIGNGPSLQKMDLSVLKDEVTMASNGFYGMFEELGFPTTFMFFEDREQTYIRRKDINRLKGVTKLVALSNAYCIKESPETIFFNEKFPGDKVTRPFFPRFSEDFASVAYLGGTVSFVMMQWACYLGFDEIYVIGVDHNYGELPKLFPPGKIKISEENVDQIQQLHFSKGYYKVGDVMGVPDVEFQESSYSLANDHISNSGKKIRNAGLESKLDAFEKVDFKSLF